MFEEFWEPTNLQKKLRKGGLPKFFELLLKVSYFFLSIHFGLQGLSKITFGGPWTYSKINLYYLYIYLYMYLYIYLYIHI